MKLQLNKPLYYVEHLYTSQEGYGDRSLYVVQEVPSYLNMEHFEKNPPKYPLDVWPAEKVKKLDNLKQWSSGKMLGEQFFSIGD